MPFMRQRYLCEARTIEVVKFVLVAQNDVPAKTLRQSYSFSIHALTRYTTAYLI